MAFFNTKNRRYYRSTVIETELQSISEPRSEHDEIFISNRLKECPMSDNSLGLPYPKDTELSKQLKLGVPLKDYSKISFIHNRDEYMSDEQAEKIYDKLNNNNNEN